MDFNEKLQELRKRKGLTQEELAEALFVSRTAVSKWESGRGYPSIDSLKVIASFFSVSIDELLSGEELVSIAQNDHVQEMLQMRDLVFGLLDCAHGAVSVSSVVWSGGGRGTPHCISSLPDVDTLGHESHILYACVTHRSMRPCNPCPAGKTSATLESDQKWSLFAFQRIWRSDFHSKPRTVCRFAHISVSAHQGNFADKTLMTRIVSAL